MSEVAPISNDTEVCDIFTQINKLAPKLTEKDLDDWAIPNLMTHYDRKIYYLSNKAYGVVKQNDNSALACAAFKEQARAELKLALSTFLFESQHWKSGRDINSYLLTTLNRLVSRINTDIGAIKKANIPICPACKLENRKEFLKQEDKLWKCKVCTQAIEDLPQERAGKIRLCKVFALHSKKGYRCPECNRFIPESSNTTFGISCPYEDCIFMGEIENLLLMSHPVSQVRRNMVSLQTNLSHDSGKELIMQDLLEADTIQPDLKLILTEHTQQEYNLLLQIIKDQISLIKRTNSASTLVQKLLMYESYRTMLEKFPEEMISYLVHRKQNADFPIQARIFQEYASMVEGYLPFTIEKKESKIDIISLTDPNLGLFLGVSTYEAEVKNNHTIPNNTKEIYIGGRKLKNYGPCFIGKIIDVTDNRTQQSLKSFIKEYSFIQIKMENAISPGTPVTVSHFRIPSHYEMMSLVWLQRIRRQLVDKIYYRFNKKKRIAGT